MRPSRSAGTRTRWCMSWGFPPHKVPHRLSRCRPTGRGRPRRVSSGAFDRRRLATRGAVSGSRRRCCAHCRWFGAAFLAAHLHVIGDGSLRGYLESLARSLGVADAVTFHGRVSDEARDEIVRRASVFAMLSRLDALGPGRGLVSCSWRQGGSGFPSLRGRGGRARRRRGRRDRHSRRPRGPCRSGGCDQLTSL